MSTIYQYNPETKELHIVSSKITVFGLENYEEAKEFMRWLNEPGCHRIVAAECKHCYVWKDCPICNCPATSLNLRNIAMVHDADLNNVYSIKNARFLKQDRYTYDMFEVIISYFCGMFSIDIIGGWNYEEQVPEYGFGTGFAKGNAFYGGFEEAYKVAHKNIQESKEDAYIVQEALTALTNACAEFHLKHNGSL